MRKNIPPEELLVLALTMALTLALTMTLIVRWEKDRAGEHHGGDVSPDSLLSGAHPLSFPRPSMNQRVH
jgi:hypothetical protein